jgi:glycosyltransferase involved in cell wall biosynthesis
MISVLTLTYKRHKILEEAIYSFYMQKRSDCEMLIINDAEDVTYEINIPNVKVFNLRKRFSSISKKLEWGFKQASNRYIYRLDDDDLLHKNGLNVVSNHLDTDHEIYRSQSHHLFVNNHYHGIHNNINTGNVYTRHYINRIKFEDKSFGEDNDITFKFGAKIKEYSDITMIYRWGMPTYHVSGMGNITEAEIKQRIEHISDEQGYIKLVPHFTEDYYAKIPN